MLGIEPRVKLEATVPLEYHGTENGGWSIVAGSLRRESVVVDVGLGEDLSFSESIIRQYECAVFGFDPTPRAIEYAAKRGNPRLRVFEYAVGPAAGDMQLFLPLNDAHVSGSIHRYAHLGAAGITVKVASIDQVFEIVGSDRINLLKLDIEGAEFDIIESHAFARRASRIDQLCVEFHHRWQSKGRATTMAAVARLKRLGFRCAWYARSTNEEFLFVHDSALPALRLDA